MAPVKEALTSIVLERVYWFVAALSFFLGLITIGLLPCESSWPTLFCLYSAATVLRLAAGAAMNRMGDGDATTVKAWNDRHHRVLVIVLNSIVGAVLLGRLAWDAFRHHTHVGLFGFLTFVFAVYLIATRWTRPNTFYARVRSATLTIVLLGTLAYPAFGDVYGLLYIGSAVECLAVVRLLQLADRFGWADR